MKMKLTSDLVVHHEEIIKTSITWAFTMTLWTTATMAETRAVTMATK